ncbi:MAG: DUF3445 domain-containing protein [Pseudomonadota bacterium]
MTKLHTPYDGSARPFTVGLHPLDPKEWIEVDERLPEYLARKNELLSERHRETSLAEPETVAAQQEVLDLLLPYLLERYPEMYRCSSGEVSVTATGDSYAIDAYGHQPLELAARLVQEDLVIMRPGADGHRIAAACVCFPSEWLLREKFGKVLADVHEPVPGLARGTRNAQMIERIFGNLSVDRPVERFNWFLLRNPDLFLPELEHTKGSMFDRDGTPRIWIRVERQTLRRLARSGDILFTIRICTDPFERLAQHEDAVELAAAMRQQILDLDPDQLEYKGLIDEGSRVIAELDRIVGAD